GTLVIGDNNNQEQNDEDEDDGTESFYAHRFVLSARSSVIKKMLASPMMESNLSIIVMQYHSDTVRSILKYLYTGAVELLPNNVLDILAAADYYDLEDLKEHCGWYSIRICMEGSSEIDICKILYAAENYRLESIKLFCFEFITQHSMDILLSSPNWHLLTEESVIAILQLESLRVPEVEIFDSLVRWAKRQYSILIEITGTDIDEREFLMKKLEKPLDCIRFASMSPFQLINHIEKSGLVNKDIMFEAYRYLATKEEPSRNQMCRLRQGVRDFKFNHLGDSKGVFHYFGTMEDTESYESPALRKIVRVTSSEMSIGYPHTLINRTPTNMYTDKSVNAHFTVDLGRKYVLCPNFYSMRYGGDSQGSIYAAPKNWQMKGSLDGVQWDVLVDHKDDLELKHGYSIGGWPVHAIHSYRYLRIQMTGPNQRDGSELCVCCFEVYGRLVKLEDD
ncbi:hypothetical protein SAMD00019534_019650, partial [Acytostelium subglobosum LB1]|uniref:hypothetical protein n=1 Tax=Acytostelium subglobosum LB1 TaxID=1410327 RepID=UPI0006450D3E